MLEAYTVLKNKISTGRYIISDIKSKINALWVDGDLTDAEKLELTAFAENNHDPNYNPMTPNEQELLSRIAALEEKIATMSAT